MMISLFILRRENAFRLYSLFFFTVAFVERYVLYPSYTSCSETFHPFFYATNPIRLLLLVILFVYYSLLNNVPFSREQVLANLPFLLFSLMILALPTYQVLYLLLFVVSCFFVPRLKRFALVSTGLIVVMAYVFLTHYQGMHRDCSRVMSIKANMYTFVTALETYAIDEKGVFPESALALYKTAVREAYWKDLVNPITRESGYQLSFRDISPQELTSMKRESWEQGQVIKQGKTFANVDFLGVRLTRGTRVGQVNGEVLYTRIDSNRYAVYGVSWHARELLYDKGQPFVLTNAQ